MTSTSSTNNLEKYNYKNKKFSLLNVKKTDTRRFKQIAMYLQKYANVSVASIYKMIEGSSDLVFIEKLRKKMKDDIHVDGCCCCDGSINVMGTNKNSINAVKAQTLYDASLASRARFIKSLGDEIKTLPRKPRILDIGTENIQMLDELEKVFDSKGNVFGLNIDDGFNHYNDVTEFVDKRFRIYDGTNIPDDLKVDIVTITAVFHHVPVSNLGPLIKSIASHAKYVIVKENDLTEDNVATLFSFQHYLFENMIRHEHLSYTNVDITKAQLDGLFARAGMAPLYVRDTNNFNNTFYCVYEHKK